MTDLYTIDSFFRFGIKVAGISGDGASYMMKAMVYNSGFNSSANLNHSFNDVYEIICFLQDIIHIATKLRNRLLSIIGYILFGNKIVSVSHLKMLIDLVAKSVHGLVYSDICPDDRQNFASLQKIMDPNVRAALAKHVIDSEGTIEYLRICQEITSSLCDDLPPLDRIYLIWRSAFFLRACRLFIKNSADKSVHIDTNFITPNAHMCIELNAKNLIILTKKFRDEGLEKLFIPTIFNSQPCEETFRKMRSMGTMNYTKINFTLLELIHLIGRVELMNDIMYFKLADSDVIFPRNPLNKTNENQYSLPSDLQIEETVRRALNVAICDAKKFGIDVNETDIKDCPLEYDPSFKGGSKNSTSNSFVDLRIARNEFDENQNDYENLRDYSESNHTPCDNSAFVNVIGAKGTKTIRKKTLMWSLSDCKEKLSSDRLWRVRGPKKKTPYRQLEFVDVCMTQQHVFKANDIKIGDWCVFRDVVEGTEDRLVLGNILSFRYIDGKTNKDKKYTWDFAAVTIGQNSRKVEVLASWHQIELINATPSINQPKHTFIQMQNYIASLSNDVIEKCNNGTTGLSKKYSKSVLNVLKNFL